jgi:GT2 family glycosyltransferase
MRREVMDVHGPLDEAYNPVQFEDIDFCYRIREQGLKATYFPGAEMYHFENVTTGGTGGINYTYVTLRNNRIFRQRWAHMFEHEGGPPAEEMHWEELPTARLEEVRDVEQI